MHYTVLSQIEVDLEEEKTFYFTDQEGVLIENLQNAIGQFPYCCSLTLKVHCASSASKRKLFTYTYRVLSRSGKRFKPWIGPGETKKKSYRKANPLLPNTLCICTQFLI